MKTETNFKGKVRQEYINVILHLIPEKANVSLQSDHDCVHLSLCITFPTSMELKKFQKDVAPYKARTA